MSHVFARQSRSLPPRAVRGEGVYLWDDRGRRYLDGSGGAAVSCLGHGDADVARAIADQVDRLAFAHTGFLTSDPAERLADRLIAHAPGDLDRVYFVSGGSEAMEAALKLARQYMLETGHPDRTRFVARRQSYHGNTLGALGAGGNAWRRAPFDPLLTSASHIEPCYEYRLREPGETSEDYAIRAADLLEAELRRLGPETVIAFVAEPVVGATAGAVPPAPGYFRRIREICDRHGVLLILDEVMCGMGRTGTLWACEQDGVAPDIAAIAKGLGGGYQPIGAMLCTRAIHDAIRDGTGAFQHGHTYGGHPVACAAADAVLRKLTDGGLADRAATMGERLAAMLHDRFGDHPHVGDIRGRGLFRALELVADRDAKRPFDPDRGVAAAIKAAAFARGLICYPTAGTIDGRRGDHVLLAPPFIVTDDHLAEICDALAGALDDVL
ncbi:aspartate aminotransferase family protein [Jannaschia sp. LMIT008]|uniref:aspartate aminotransferase family protein n=1 Tax=Jannaschia maritima TaxID=3032585 RepID=UPI0028113619|nr:aspartate aminotransferase family protein [Jannaschia sp. LMIT008]